MCSTRVGEGSAYSNQYDAHKNTDDYRNCFRNLRLLSSKDSMRTKRQTLAQYAEKVAQLNDQLQSVGMLKSQRAAFVLKRQMSRTSADPFAFMKSSKV